MKSAVSAVIWSVRTLVALAVLGVLICLWIVQFLLFTPLLLCALFLRDRAFTAGEPVPAASGYAPASLVFDRLLDASKLYGCNTRSVRYRWTVFLEALDAIKSARPPGEVPRALDFGAGTLRDTYELARMGFQVSASDLNEAGMAEGLKFYDWNSVPHKPVCLSGPLESLLGDATFHVMTSFDVIEHLFDPAGVLAHLHRHLTPDGMLLITVPNRRTIGERVGRLRHWLRVKRGKPDYSGVPHVQFRTPREWRAFFESHGFRVHRHDMTIGALVNDVWAGFYGLPIRIFIEPVVRKIAALCGFSYSKFRFEKIFYPAWLMRLVDRLDEKLKPALAGQWAWNLFVLQRA